MTYDVAKHWDKSHFNHPKDREASNYAKDKEKLFPRNSIVCDLGGGDGIDSAFFIEKGHQVYLFDISEIALKRAQENPKLYGLKNKLITKKIDLNKDKIPTPDNLFDVVYARLSLHYFYQNRMIEIFKDIYRVLKKGGIAYIVVKSPDDKNETKWTESHGKKIKPGIYSENGLIKTRFTKKQYQSILIKAKINSYKILDYTEEFGNQKTYVKSQADKLLYNEIIINKSF